MFYDIYLNEVWNKKQFNFFFQIKHIKILELEISNNNFRDS